MAKQTGLQKLQRASWQGVDGTKIEFPVRRVSVKGSLRHHIHEYPHAPGGAFENLGRKLYEIRMSCSFMETFKLYPNLWPLNLDTLRNSFERGDVGKLTIPTLGTIDARCVNWDQEMDVKIQSGEMVELEFIEDQSQLFLIDFIVAQVQQDVASATDNFNLQLEKANILAGPPQQVSIFSAIRDAANAVLAYFDQLQAVGQLLSAKIEGLLALIQQADDDLDVLQHPENLAVILALRELWLANFEILENLQSKQEPVGHYVVPALMSIGDVSTALYGDATHSIELLQLNAVDDALAIAAGTRIAYYPVAQTTIADQVGSLVTGAIL